MSDEFYTELPEGTIDAVLTLARRQGALRDTHFLVVCPLLYDLLRMDRTFLYVDTKTRDSDEYGFYLGYPIKVNWSMAAYGNDLVFRFERRT